MRRLMLLCVLLSLLALGCNRKQAPPADRFQASDTSQAAPDQATLPETAKTGPAAENSSDSGEPAVDLDAITLTAPAGWERKPAGSPFVVAEFVLPRVEGDDADGRLTISAAGGSVEANIDRWKGQFDPQPEAASQEEVDIAGLKVTIVDLSGNFNDQRGPFAPGEMRPGYRMIAAVIPVDGQLHFIKATGPQKTIASHADTIQQFIRSVQRKD